LTDVEWAARASGLTKLELPCLEVVKFHGIMFPKPLFISISFGSTPLKILQVF